MSRFYRRRKYCRFTAEGITVIDFKFGEIEKPDHIRQVRSYMEQLRQMDYKHVEGYIWYVIMDKTIKI